ncbi:BURP domain protein RD22-like [Gastrolobium bilobum]|uniref:BURP domain protein RD22-like n=1 Tax=Gastrolobium bilobum TaxID=150636 RepID=UPI002AB0AF69|nr:BURP domain protein RD22-like [Gastrolobium bilobum]
MEFPLLPIFTLLSLALVATHAALPPEFYWKSKLPTTPMPKAITDLLYPDWVEDKSTSVAVGKGGVNVDAGKTKPGGTSVDVGKGGVNVNAGKGKPAGTSVNVGKGGVNVHAGKGKPGGTSVNVGKGGVNVHAGKGKGKPVHVAVGKSPFDYNYAATETQLHDNPNVALFFLEKDLHHGSKFNLHFTKTSNAATFLPRQVADSIPFSSNKVDDILNKFSVKPESEEAEIMKNTISECEEPAIRGEEKLCVTSLESMVDFSTSKLGNNVEAVSTEVNKETELQQYSIAKGVKKIGGEDKGVVCHKQNYPYAVFYCHKTDTTRAYSVPLEGADGSRIKAVAVCHTDTSQWNPKHLAFQVLKVQPGTVPVCHFLPQDHVVWVTK